MREEVLWRPKNPLPHPPKKAVKKGRKKYARGTSLEAKERLPRTPSEKAGKKERKKYTRETSLSSKEVSLALPQESRLEKNGAIKNQLASSLTIKKVKK